MKLTIPKSRLASALSAVSAVATTRSVSPVLAFAKLECGISSAAVIATDLDCRYQRELGDCTVSEPADCLIPVSKVKEWLGIVGNGDVTLEHDGGQLKLSMPGSGSIKFSTPPVDEFPSVRHDDRKYIAEADFAPIKHIAWAMQESSDARPELRAVFIEPVDGGLECETTNGRMVGTVKVEAFRDEKPWMPLALPAKYVNLVTGLGKCTLLESSSSLHFVTSEFHITVRKTESPVPNWRRSISNPQFPYIGSVTVMRDEMAQTIAQCHILRGGELGSEHGVCVRFEPDDGVKVTCLVEKTSDSYSNTVDGKIRGEFPPVHLSTEYIGPFFSLPDESPLKIEFTGPTTMVHMNAPDLKVDFYFAPLFRKEAK